MRVENNKKTINQNFQMLRGICALIVFFSHALNFFPLQWVESLSLTPLHLVFDGQCAVMVFFLLSGYLHYNNRESGLKSYLGVLKRKVLRIYPVHVLCIIVGYVLIMYFQSIDTSHAHSLMTSWATKFWTSEVTLKEVLCNALIVLPHDSDLINPPTWYLFTEVRMFIVMPLIIWAAKRMGYSLMYMLLIPSFFVQIPFLQYLFPFVLGASLHRNIDNINLNSQWKTSALVISGILLLDINNIIFIDNASVIVENIILSLQSLGVAMIILALAKRSGTSTNVLTRMGDISYEFYIVHFLVVMSLSLLFPTAIIMLPLSFALSILIAKTLNRAIN